MRGLLLAAIAAVVVGVAVAEAVTRGADPARRPTLVAVSAGSGPGRSVATGFAAGRGRVVTVAHVLDAGGALRVRGADDRRRPARLLRVDRRLDLAVLAVHGLPGRRVRPTADGDALRILVRRAEGRRALPARVRRRVLATVQTATGATAAHRPALELAAALDPGDSGAPVVTPGGAVAGVVFATSSRRPRTAYAVSGTALAAVLGALAGS